MHIYVPSCVYVDYDISLCYRVTGHNAEQVTGDHQNDVYTILTEDVYTDSSSVFLLSNMILKNILKIKQ